MKKIKKFPKYHSKFIFFLQFSLNEDFLFSGGKDKKLKMMNLETLETIQEFSFINSVFYSIELHSEKSSRLYVSGKSNSITRKFYINGDLREKLTSKPSLIEINQRKSKSKGNCK